MNCLPVNSFLTIALLRCFSAFCKILACNWLDDVIQSTTTMSKSNVRKVNTTEVSTLTQIKLNLVLNVTFYVGIRHKNF